MSEKKFSKEVQDNLRYYVYRLLDPRNGETFYVGKGKGDRVFDHINNPSKQDTSQKAQRIQSINMAGLEIAIIIHRHGLNEETALEVEAALIDAYPGLTNRVSGHGSSEYGAMHPSEVIKKYGAAEANFKDMKAIIFKIHKSCLEKDLYEATRYAWKVGNKRIYADHGVAAINGLIVEVYKIKEWVEANEKHFPGMMPLHGKFAFIGEVADEQTRSSLIGKRLPMNYRQRGDASPFRYTY